MSINIKLLRKILNRCLWNPKEPGPMRVVTDANNLDYYRERAIESIATSKYSPQPDEHIIIAIRVLLLILVNYELKEKHEQK